MKFKR